MKKTVLKRDMAKRAIIEIADQLSQDSILVGAGFIDALERTLDVLASSPEIAAKWEIDLPRLKDIRVWQVDGFSQPFGFLSPDPRRN